MKRVLCMLRRGHVPVRLAISSTRIVCSRCGIELESTMAREPAVANVIPTTIRRRSPAKRR